MTVKELIEKLKTVDSDMEIFIEGRDSTGEYCDAHSEKHIIEELRLYGYKVAYEFNLLF